MATTAKAGSRRANCPIPTLLSSVRQRRKVVTPHVQSDEWSLRWMLYSKPAMSINWKASLVPAAAVIPAPAAYTDAVAVKTLVVDLRAQGHGGLALSSPASSSKSRGGVGRTGGLGHREQRNHPKNNKGGRLFLGPLPLDLVLASVVEPTSSPSVEVNLTDGRSRCVCNKDVSESKQQNGEATLPHGLPPRGRGTKARRTGKERREQPSPSSPPTSPPPAGRRRCARRMVPSPSPSHSPPRERSSKSPPREQQQTKEGEAGE